MFCSRSAVGEPFVVESIVAAGAGSTPQVDVEDGAAATPAGSRFIVSLPLAREEAEIPVTQQVRSSGNGFSRRILVVDDNADATECCVSRSVMPVTSWRPR